MFTIVLAGYKFTINGHNFKIYPPLAGYRITVGAKPEGVKKRV